MVEDLQYAIELVALAIFILSMFNKLKLHLAIIYLVPLLPLL